MQSTILLIAPESTANPVADALRRGLDVAVEIAANRRSGLASLRRGEYALVLLEESIAAADPETTDLIYQNAGAAPVLEINFVIAGPPRIVRQVRASLTRNASDQVRARAFATTALQGELNSSLSGLLLESQLALRSAPPELAPKIRHLVELASDLRNRLRA